MGRPTAGEMSEPISEPGQDRVCELRRGQGAQGATGIADPLRGLDGHAADGHTATLRIPECPDYAEAHEIARRLKFLLFRQSVIGAMIFPKN